jgi:hypothetical protein
MSESLGEQLSRVSLMAKGDDQWDLSDNDCAALTAVLARIAQLEEALRFLGGIKYGSDAVSRLMPDIERGEVRP